MDELGVARAIASGELPSPQRYENMLLVALRITGTGAAYRQGLNEYVWRDSSYYLNDDFLARINGLPVIIEHPATKMLDSQEYADRNVGSVMLPYIKGDEVWAVCRIYDAAAAELLASEQLSTSPCVVFAPNDPGKIIDLNDGSHLLIEGKPALVDHIAICMAGVWDKGGAPAGVESAAASEGIMTEEHEEKKAAEERHDAASDLMTKLDEICSKLDAAHKRMDALEARHRKDVDLDENEKHQQERRERAEGEEEEALADRKRKDAKGRKDIDLKEWAEEEEEEPEHRDDTESEKERAEHLERGAKKAVEKLEEEARHDRHGHRRHDSETEEERRALEKAHEARERKDSAIERENAELKRRLAAIESSMRELTREMPPEERDALAAAQARADAVAALFGERVPAPIPGETSLAYRRRLLQRFQKYSPQFKSSSLASADEAILTAIEGQIYADAQAAAKNVAGDRPGVLVPHVTTDAAGRQITRFYGDPMAWMQHFVRGGTRGRIIRPPMQGRV